jgi:hypothetical protein
MNINFKVPVDKSTIRDIMKIFNYTTEKMDFSKNPLIKKLKIAIRENPAGEIFAVAGALPDDRPLGIGSTEKTAVIDLLCNIISIILTNTKNIDCYRSVFGFKINNDDKKDD